jgi:hypothetical protein
MRRRPLPHRHGVLYQTILNRVSIVVPTNPLMGRAATARNAADGALLSSAAKSADRFLVVSVPAQGARYVRALLEKIPSNRCHHPRHNEEDDHPQRR